MLYKEMRSFKQSWLQKEKQPFFKKTTTKKNCKENRSKNYKKEIKFLVRVFGFFFFFISLVARIFFFLLLSFVCWNYNLIN